MTPDDFRECGHALVDWLADVRAEVQDRLAAATKTQQNEWRMTIDDITQTKMGHTEYEAAHAVLVEKIDNLAQRLDKHEGRGVGASQAWVWVFLGVGGIVGLGGFLFGLIELLTK